ncbi:unnamed protein product, partial [Rhizoctonia solani]
MANPSLKASVSSVPQDNAHPLPANRGVTTSRIISQYIDKNRSQILWAVLGVAVFASALCDRILMPKWLIFIPSKWLHHTDDTTAVALWKRITTVFACLFFPRLADLRSRVTSGIFACKYSR